ncbi:hypothetical protein EDD15DRAFT_2280362, partial [Pisolithus albus]
RTLLTIDVGGSVGNVSAADFLDVPDTHLLVACQDPCRNATILIQVRTPPILLNLHSTTSTYIELLVPTTSASAVPFAESTGSPRWISLGTNWSVFETVTSRDVLTNQPISAYGTACSSSVNVTIPSQIITLQVPPNWDGPYLVVLSLPATAVVVAAGALLGGSALLLLSNM